MRRILSLLPAWSLTTVVTVAILYLTLVPKPRPDNDLMIIPGMDKIAHALMFGGLTLVMAIDYTRRRHGFNTVAPRRLFMFAAIAAVFGGIIEIAQQSMGLGRGGDVADLTADIAGAIIFALIANRVIRFIGRH